MAISIDNFRARLQNKLWSDNSPISRIVTIYTAGSTITDDYGDEYIVSTTSTTSKAIPYSKFPFQQDFLMWGELQDGQTDMVFPYNTTLENDSTVVDANETTTSYNVVNIETFPYGNGIVAKVARLSEKL